MGDFYSRDTEEAALGCCIVDASLTPITKNSLKYEDFYFEHNVELFKLICRVYEKNKTFDATILTSMLGSKDLELKLLVIHCPDRVSTTDKLLEYIKRIKELSSRRKLQKLGIGFSSGEKDLKELAIEGQSQIREVIKDSQIYEEGPSLKKTAHIVMDSLEENMGKTEYEMPTGFCDLDDRIGGWKRKRLYVIGGRPGMGKTSFATSTAKNVAEFFKKKNEGRKVYFYSLEMGKEDMFMRLVNLEAKVNNKKLEVPKYLSAEDLKKIAEATDKILSLPITIEDRMRKPQDIMFDIQVNKPDFVIVDYVQMLLFSIKQTEKLALFINKTIAEFMFTAKENNCAMILISQLKREVEGRRSMIPRQGDFKGGGGFEEIGDFNAFIVWPPEIYKKNPDTKKDWTEEQKKKALLIMGKNKFGAKGNVYFRFEPQWNLFQNYSSRDEEEMAI